MRIRPLPLLLALCAGGAQAADDIEVRDFALPAAHEALSLHGELHGRETRDYRFDAPAGSCVQAKLRSRHGGAAFNLLPPEGEAALFISTLEGPEWQGVLREGGRYTLRVYLVRSAARRSEEAEFRLRVLRLTEAECAAQPGR